MSLYTRHQLALLLALIGAAGAGLGVDHWRRVHPDVAEGLELLDRAPPPPAPPSAVRHPPARPLTPRVVEPTPPVDLNHAPIDDLERLPGVGRALAIRIVNARPFASVDELVRVRGLRGARLTRLRTLVTVAP